MSTGHAAVVSSGVRQPPLITLRTEAQRISQHFALKVA